MQIDYPTRTVRTGIGALASFASSRARRRTNLHPDRARIGSEWHRRIQDEAEPTAEEEVTLRGSLASGLWCFVLHGRLDQLDPHAIPPRIREIKTVGHLPPDPGTAREVLPSYFLQTALYHRLWNTVHGIAPDAALLLVDFTSGTRREHPLDDSDLAAADDALAKVAALLESRRSSFLRPPIEGRRLRPAQEEVLAALEAAFGQAPVVGFEAPTGFGKTFVYTTWLAGRLGAEPSLRGIVLTGKGSGRTPVATELGHFGIPHLAMRSRRDHRPSCPLLACSPFSCDPAARQPEIEDLIEAASEDAPPPQGYCPYQRNRALLPLFRVWIADYNYIFANRSRGVFEDTPGYHPAQTALVIDEAHNLPERVAAAWSVALHPRQLHALAEDLALLGLPQRPLRLLERLSKLLEDLKSDAIITLTEAYSIEDALEEALEELFLRPLPDTLEDSTVERIAALQDLRQRFGDEAVPALRHRDPAGNLRVDCTDPAPLVARTLGAFRYVLLTSATLSPVDVFARSTGLGEIPFVRADPSWKPGHLELAIDRRFDTRSRQRERSTAGIAATLARLAETAPESPAVVFGPSFQYLELLAVYLREVAPHLRVEQQDREDPDAVASLDLRLRSCDLLLLVLGSRLAEGIDELGGRVSRAAVVSPGIPEVTRVRDTTRATIDQSGANGFELAYVAPGMRKVVQAVGRLVRDPSHHSRVLLIGKRFADPLHQRHFPSWWPAPTEIGKASDFDNWIAAESA